MGRVLGILALTALLPLCWGVGLFMIVMSRWMDSRHFRATIDTIVEYGASIISYGAIAVIGGGCLFFVYKIVTFMARPRAGQHDPYDNFQVRTPEPKQIEIKPSKITTLIEDATLGADKAARKRHWDEKANNERIKGQIMINRESERKQKNTPTVSVETPVEIVPIITTPAQAYQLSTSNEFYFAQYQDAEKEFLFWQPSSHETPHIRIHGSSGSGKTSLACGIIANAVMQGLDVIIVDKLLFKNFPFFRGHAQLVDARHPLVLLELLKHVHRTHDERIEQLGYLGLPDISHMDNPVQRILVVIDEFFSQMNWARKYGLFDEILSILESITAVSRSTGIHFLFLDQKPTNSNWGEIMRANVQFALLGYMPKHQSRTTTGTDYGQKLSGHRFLNEMDGRVVKGWANEKCLSSTAANGQFPPYAGELYDLTSIEEMANQELTPISTESGQLAERIGLDRRLRTDDSIGQALKRAILARYDSPDAKIAELAGEYDVSTTYVKEAKKWLVANGYFEMEVENE